MTGPEKAELPEIEIDLPNRAAWAMERLLLNVEAPEKETELPPATGPYMEIPDPKLDGSLADREFTTTIRPLVDILEEVSTLPATLTALPIRAKHRTETALPVLI